jgi:hypothetical protein
MMVRYSIGLLLILISGVRNLSGQDIEKLVPPLSELEGWKFTSEPKVYIGDDLFSLIDGGADLYLEYGFTKVVSAQYADPSSSNILIEIYKMKDSPSAYGIFSITQQGVEWSVQFGNLSVVDEDYICFWKGRYYVNISWSSRQLSESPLLNKLADLVVKNIPDTGNYPDMLKTFQDQDPVEKTIYLKGNLALSNFYYFDYRDIFKIKEALAYSLENHKRVIIKYPDKQTAIERLADARQGMSKNKRFSDMATAFQGFSCTDNKGNHILIRHIENYVVILVALNNSIDLEPYMEEITRDIENAPDIPD